MSLETNLLVFTILLWELRWGMDCSDALSQGSGLAGYSFSTLSRTGASIRPVLRLTDIHLSQPLWTQRLMDRSLPEVCTQASFPPSVMSAPPSLAQPPSGHSLPKAGTTGLYPAYRTHLCKVYAFLHLTHTTALGLSPILVRTSELTACLSSVSLPLSTACWIA